MADHPDYFDHFGYGKIKHERLLRREANKAAWAANVEARRLQRRVEIGRSRGHMPRGGSIIWGKVAEWAESRGCSTEARRARQRVMPYWQPGDDIPMRLVKDIVRECLRFIGTKRLRNMEREAEAQAKSPR